MAEATRMILSGEVAELQLGALLAVLRVRHSWARRAMDARSVLIIDEVHAGDPYMIALVEILVDAHPGPVILLSATLGSYARQRLLRCDGEPQAIS